MAYSDHPTSQVKDETVVGNVLESVVVGVVVDSVVLGVDVDSVVVVGVVHSVVADVVVVEGVVVDCTAELATFSHTNRRSSPQGTPYHRPSKPISAHSSANTGSAGAQFSYNIGPNGVPSTHS